MKFTKEDVKDLFINLLEENLVGIKCVFNEPPPNNVHKITLNRTVFGNIPFEGINPLFGTGWSMNIFIRIAGLAISIDQNSDDGECWKVIAKETERRAVLCAIEISKTIQNENSIHIHCDITEAVDVVAMRQHIGIYLKWW